MVFESFRLRCRTVLFALVISFSFVNGAAAQIADATVEDLITQLQETDLARRRDAAYELVRRQLGSEDVVLALASATSDDDTQVRFQALFGLARVANSAGPAIPELLKCLDDRDDQVRFRAADALGKVGSPALQPLLEVWDQGSQQVRIAACQAMAEMGPTAQPAHVILAESLVDAPQDLARHIAVALAAIDPNNESELVKMAQHSEASVRRIGIMALADIAASSNETTATLKQAVQDVDAKIRESAVIALAKSKLERQEKETVIKDALLDSSTAVRAAAVVAMRRADLANHAFAEKLAGRLKDAKPESRNAIYKALETIGIEAANTLPMVLDSIPAVANQTEISPGEIDIDEAQLISTIASFGETVVVNVLQAIEKRPGIEPILSRSLAAIGAPALPAIVDGMSSDSELIRIASTRALGSVENLDTSVVARMAQAVSDESPQVRALAVAALIQHVVENSSVENSSVGASLLAATNDRVGVVRAAALEALYRFDFNEAEVVSALQLALADEEEAVRASALRTLAQLPNVLATSRARVLDLSLDPSASVRQAASVCLAKIPPSQRDAFVVGALVRLLNDDDLTVQIAATEAVQALELVDEKILQVMAENLQQEAILVSISLEVTKALGEKAVSLSPAVVGQLKHQRANIRVAAIETLAALEKDSVRQTNWLIEMLDDSEWEVRRIAGVKLGQLGPAAKAAVPKLFELLNSEEDSDFASGALREIDAAPVEAMELLIGNLDSEERRVGYYAITLLGKIGQPAKAALPKLEAMLEEAERSGGGRSGFRQRFLREAIAKIKGES